MGFTVILASVVLAVSCGAAGPSIAAGECRDQIAPSILIRIAGSKLPALAEAHAKIVAEKILKPAGIRLIWSASEFPPDLRRCAALVVVLDVGGRVPAGSDDAWGFASPYASSGSRIHIFWDRIESGSQKEHWGCLLGHVFAHEITHILQGVARHSSEGLMKPHWTLADLYRMAYRPLPLTAEDIDLIHLGLAALREKATADSGPSAGH
jgi:hypothetical protein